METVGKLVWNCLGTSGELVSSLFGRFGELFWTFGGTRLKRVWGTCVELLGNFSGTVWELWQICFRTLSTRFLHVSELIKTRPKKHISLFGGINYSEKGRPQAAGARWMLAVYLPAYTQIRIVL